MHAQTMLLYSQHPPSSKTWDDLIYAWHLTNLWSYTMMMVMMMMILLYVWCLYVLFVLICKCVWLSYYSAKFHSYATITVLGLIITISVYHYSFITDHLLMVCFLVYLITDHSIAWCYAFVCRIICAQSIVHVVHIACAWLFFKLF